MASVVILCRWACQCNSPKLYGNMFRSLLLASTLVVLIPGHLLGHDFPGHPDPELLAGWRTGLHLTIQWTHLTASALWLGLTAGTLLLGIKPPLDHLLYSSWALSLVMLATGAYNMDYSAGISATPSLFLLTWLRDIPYGVTTTALLAVKIALYGLLVLLTFAVTILRLRGKDEKHLRKTFLLAGSILTVLATLVAAVVLFYHEVADLWPRVVHSSGGLMAPDGPLGQSAVERNGLSPNDFWLLTTTDAWIDIGVRWLHLLGFGLWLGGSAAALVFGPVSPARFLLVAWSALILQVLTGIASMVRWTPFYLPPYLWNLSELSQLRFGRSYTLLMAVKQGLVLSGTGLLLAATYQWLRSGSGRRPAALSLRSYLAAAVALGLAIAYIMMIVLLLHEGVDHAL